MVKEPIQRRIGRCPKRRENDRRAGVGGQSFIRAYQERPRKYRLSRLQIARQKTKKRFGGQNFKPRSESHDKKD